MCRGFGRDSAGRAGRKIATIGLGATIVESWKREAKASCQGGSGCQPVLALWAEMNAALADELRDGNVPAEYRLLPATRRTFQALPETVQERYFRGGSSCCEEELPAWLRNERREAGPQGFIGFAVSARMNPALREQIEATPEERRQWHGEDGGAVKECAVADYFPEETPENRCREPLRYVAIRIRHKQGAMFADGSRVKHFAVAGNLWDEDAKKLLPWHRQKAGPIEAAHDAIKNQLAGGAMPCGRFGSNAARFRLAALTYNVPTAPKRLALPAELPAARPKRLRFPIINTPGKPIHHARRAMLRLAGS
ncbi:MAG: transposase [Bryobacteraceae bacterium]